MITLLKKFPIPFTLGLCLPVECQLEDLEEFKPFLTKAINGALPNLFEDVKGFGSVPVIDESDVAFVDPKVENEKVLKFDIVSGISCALIVFFSIATLIATFLLWSKSRDALKLRNRSSLERSNSSHGSMSDESPSSATRRSISNSGSFSSNNSGPQSEDSGCTKFLRSFNATENLSRLSKPRAKMGDQELEVLNGLRVICCILIILGNSYFYTLRSPIQNLEVVQDWV